MESHSTEKVPVSIIMAGGEGTRFGRSDKYMVQIGGMPMLDRIVRVAHTLSDEVIICTKEKYESTVRYCQEKHLRFLIDNERDYIDAQRFALCKIHEFPALMLSADLFIFGLWHLRDFIHFALMGDAGVVTLLQRGNPVGVSLFNECRSDLSEISSESFNVMGDFCVNVNTLRDYQIALEIYSSRRDSI